MGQLMKEQGLLPDVIYSSTARRALETTEAFVAASGFGGEMITTPRLYLAEPKAYLDLFSEVRPGTSCAMFVAHNPGIADLVEQLTGHPQQMCTAGLVHVSLPLEEIAGIETTTRGVFEGLYRPPRDLTV
jgi:phosphohistidine phosphatase